MSKNKACPTYKVILLGNSDVGKTSLFRKLRGDRRLESPGKEILTGSSTVSIELRPYTLKFRLDKTLTVKLEVHDTGSAERFRDTIPSNYYRNTHGVVLVYDITNSISLFNLEEWVTDVQNKCGEEGITYSMIGNKLDQVHDEQDLFEGIIYGERLDIPPELQFKVSVMGDSRQRLREVFQAIARAIHAEQSRGEQQEEKTAGEKSPLLKRKTRVKRSRYTCCCVS